MPRYLDEILEAHRARSSADAPALSALAARAADSAPSRGFTRALLESDDLAVIAEIKRRSPSKGDLDPALDPAEVASAYHRGGARCLSVLTDSEFFGGSSDDLAAARGACPLPVLRKDFTVCLADVLEARIMGADAVLLIVAALDDLELRSLHDEATGVGLDVLVEVHDEIELGRALGIGAQLIGVNQRDLTTFAVDTGRAARLARHIPDEVVRVAESGIRSLDDVRQLADDGYDAVLVGESLVTSGDRRAAVAALAGVARRSGRLPTAPRS
ncbi:MAG: indole-3-glycerol phosphate synthase TrpC [Acidimicrobiales bacterium]